uniref:B-cell receptor CD22-like n=1 Tax=Crassostrea virginica TaxID=6565 RepID=A0A8B8CEK0_CRAVI|nr:B-cell receptor CD22-like [Crassostrea virginica]
MLFLQTANFFLASFIFIYTIKVSSTSTEYHETGSDVCLTFALTDIPNLLTVFIRKANLNICASFDRTHTYIFEPNWGNRTFNCSVSAKRVSLCFDDFQQTDEGLFSLHSSAITEDPSLKSITLKQAIPVREVNLSVITTPITVIIGQQINLTCTTSYCIPPANITWYKSAGDSQTRSTLVKSGGLVKTISSIQSTIVKEDNGKRVFCKASNIRGKEVTSFMNILNVMYKPEVRCSLPHPYRIQEGRIATLICTVIDANPNTSITWRWNKQDNLNVDLHNGPAYTIPNIQREKSGTYVCTASNSVGTSEGENVVIDVQYKPEVVSAVSSPYRVTEGQTAILVCTVIAANPVTTLTWKWIKADSPIVELHNGPNYTIPNIQRRASGSYICTASNTVGTSDGVNITIDVQYKPEVEYNTPNPYKVIEGQTATLICTMTTANPNSSTTWKWIKTDSPTTVLHNGPNYTIFNIQRGSSGSYSCTASNSVGTSDPATVNLDVQFQPSIEIKQRMIVNETDRVVLTRQINSNPLANVSWLHGTKMLKRQFFVKTTSFIIETAQCTDTMNFTLMASNIVESNVTSRVELIVNCKPTTEKTYVSVGITDTSGIRFSSIIIAYPLPQYVLEYEDGTKINGMTDTLTWNSVNNFTIHFNKSDAKPRDYGLYRLRLSNVFGNTVIYVNVFPQRKPDSPKSIEVICDVKRARVKWKSSFNGGDPQTFTAFAINGQKGTHSHPLPDRGENEIHETFVENLQPSLTYVFYVSARNSHGNSSSDIKSCAMLKETSDQTGVVAGSLGGSLALVIVVCIIVVIVHRHYTCSCACNVEFAKRNKTTAREDETYTHITDHENTERNLYDELARNESEKQYEPILMKEREANAEKPYESLSKSEDNDRNVVSETTGAYQEF